MITLAKDGNGNIFGTYKFTSGSYLTPSGLFQLVLEVNVMNGVDNPFTEYTFADANIIVKDIAEIEKQFDEDEFFIALPNLSAEFIDKDKILYQCITSKWFSGDTTRLILNRNGEEYLTGTFDDENYTYSTYTHFKANFNAPTARLNEYASNIDGTFNDKFSAKYEFSVYEIVNYNELLEDFFKLVNPTVTLDNYINYDFRTAIYNGNTYTGQYPDLTVIFKYLFGREEASGFVFHQENYVQALKSGLLGLGFFGGFKDQKTAFIMPYLDFSNRPLIDTSNLLGEFEESNDRNRYKYLEIKNGNHVWTTRGAKTGLQQDEKIITTIGDVYKIWVSSLADNISLADIKRHTGTGYTEMFNFVADQFEGYYLNRIYKKQFRFKLKGIDYNLYDLFLVNDQVCFPTSIRCNIKDNSTEIIGRLFSDAKYFVKKYSQRINSRLEKSYYNFYPANVNSMLEAYVLEEYYGIREQVIGLYLETVLNPLAEPGPPGEIYDYLETVLHPLTFISEQTEIKPFLEYTLT